VLPPDVSLSLEGEMRPTHFQGVATVVLKLLNLVQPQVAVFGQKDYQQLLVVRRMVRDLNVPVEIRMAPTVREPDGLALSSRNRYLDAAQRVTAGSLYRALRRAEAEIYGGVRDATALSHAMRTILNEAGIERIDYAVVRNPDTLEAMDPVRLPAVALVAAYVGTTRLIDNWIVR
jgi:pantoate--beta-alanine ligase